MKTKLLLLVLPLISLAAQNGPGPRTPTAGANTAGACPPSGGCVDMNASAACVGAGANGSAGCVRPDGCPVLASTNPQPTTLSAAELIAAVDQERMARELYRTAADRWPSSVFATLAAAEARHEAVFQRLAATSGVTLPGAQPGVFANADTQTLHDELARLIAGSSTGALKAAALLEETNLVDLRQLRAHATDAATPLVLTQLERASSHHLGALVRTLEAAGETYQPRVLSPAEYAAALASPGGPAGGRGYRGGR